MNLKAASLPLALRRNWIRYLASRSSGHSSSSSSGSSSSAAATASPPESVYVHPLSQIVLVYMQSNRHDWIIEKQLDKSLRLHRDGTFVLQFQDDSSSRIWTSYDPNDKKHWLSFQRNQIQHRFMLQDNLMPAWHGKRKSLPERIHQSVDELIQAVDELD